MSSLAARPLAARVWGARASTHRLDIPSVPWKPCPGRAIYPGGSAPQRNAHKGRGALRVSARRGGRGFMKEMKSVREGVDEPKVRSIEFERPLQIRMYPDPCLRAKNKEVNTFDATLKQLAADMFAIMYKTDGVGLAAPQVGVNLRLMVYNPEGDPRTGQEYILVNPKIIRSSKETEPFEEGCLSFPKLYKDVVRPSGVDVEYQDVNGQRMSFQLGGFQARVFQHEYDHLQGTLYHDRMAEDVRAKAEPELQRMRDEWMEATGDEGAP